MQKARGQACQAEGTTHAKASGRQTVQIIWGLRCCLSHEMQTLQKATRIPAGPDAAFLRLAIEVDSAGLFRSKFVCLWKRGKQP